MIAAIVLAAGESNRMGTQKLLLPFASSTVIGHIIEQLLLCPIDIIVVTGCERERIAEELSGRRVTIAHNPDYKEGMLSSVRRGLRELPEQCEAAMVVLGDQPSITAELVETMIQTFNESDKGIVVPVFDQKRGHPMLFSTKYRYEILTSYDNVGLRGLLRENAEDIQKLNIETDAILSDMDYPEDYQREIDRQRHHDPSFKQMT